MSQSKTKSGGAKAATRNAGPLTVAVDDGYAQTKVYGEGPDGKIVTLCMRSSVRPGRYGLSDLSGRGAQAAYDTDEGDPFTVSDQVEAEDTKFEGFHVSTMNRVLVNHALIRTGFAGRDVRLMTGVPVEDFFFDGEKDEDLIGRKRDNLLKPVYPVSGGETAKIGDVYVGCQAVAAFFDYVVGDDLKERADWNKTIAVVDVGGRTTDVAVVRNGQSIDHRMSGTENLGVLDVYEAVAKGVRRKFRTKDEFALAALDRAVRERKVTLWSEDHDVDDVVGPIVTEHENRIVREVDRRLGSAAQIDRVVFVGGGGALFSSIAEKMKNGYVPESPELANARGMWKFARYMKLFD